MTFLKIDQVSFVTHEKVIVDQVSFDLEKGEFLTLTGPSGSGKSTLLKLVASLLTPTNGDIYLENKVQSDYQLNLYRQEVSYCFQQPVLFGQTVRDNLSFPFTVRKKNFDRNRAIALLQQVALPETFLDKHITSLSGGEKQRVALIRNLLFLPKVLLLDEVTVGLDDENKNIIHQLIQAVHKEGITILQITHDNSEIAQAKRILTMAGGALVEQSTKCE